MTTQKLNSNYPEFTALDLTSSQKVITLRSSPYQSDDPLSWAELDNNFELLRYSINSLVDDIAITFADLNYESDITNLSSRIGKLENENLNTRVTALEDFDLNTRMVALEGYNMPVTLAEFGNRITEVETADSGFDTRLTEVESQIPVNLSATVSGLSSDVSALQTDASSFSTSLSTFETNLTGLQTDVTGLQTTVDNLPTPSGSGLPKGYVLADDFCVGDGVADDTANLQAAIDSLGERGGTVLLGNKEYLLASNDGTMPWDLIPDYINTDQSLRGNASDGSLDGTEDHTHPAFRLYAWFRDSVTDDAAGFLYLVGTWNGTEFSGGADSAGFNYWASSGRAALSLWQGLYQAEYEGSYKDTRHVIVREHVTIRGCQESVGTGLWRGDNHPGTIQTEAATFNLFPASTGKFVAKFDIKGVLAYDVKTIEISEVAGGPTQLDPDGNICPFSFSGTTLTYVIDPNNRSAYTLDQFIKDAAQLKYNRSNTSSNGGYFTSGAESNDLMTLSFESITDGPTRQPSDYITLQGLGSSIYKTFSQTAKGSLIRIRNSTTLVMKRDTALTNLTVMSDTIDGVASSFSGYGVRPSADDVLIQNCFIGGFEYGIYANWTNPDKYSKGNNFGTGGRLRVTSCNMDNINCIQVKGSYDITYIDKVHCWPFLTGNPMNNINQSIGWDWTWFNCRDGIAFDLSEVNDWTKITDSFSYGYRIGFHVRGSRSVILSGCGADNASYGMTTTLFNNLLNHSSQQYRDHFTPIIEQHYADREAGINNYNVMPGSIGFKITRNWGNPDPFYGDYSAQFGVDYNKNGYIDDGTPFVNAGEFVVGIEYTIWEVGTTNWLAIGATSSTKGTKFTATGPGSGDGVAYSRNEKFYPGTGSIMLTNCQAAAQETAYTFDLHTNECARMSASSSWYCGTHILASATAFISVVNQLLDHSGYIDPSTGLGSIGIETRDNANIMVTNVQFREINNNYLFSNKTLGSNISITGQQDV